MVKYVTQQRSTLGSYKQYGPPYFYPLCIVKWGENEIGNIFSPERCNKSLPKDEPKIRGHLWGQKVCTSISRLLQDDSREPNKRLWRPLNHKKRREKAAFTMLKHTLLARSQIRVLVLLEFGRTLVKLWFLGWNFGGLMIELCLVFHVCIGPIWSVFPNCGQKVHREKRPTLLG